MRRPNGCDQQGRYPEAAESATELGADRDYSEADEFSARLLLAVTAVAVAFIAIGLVAWWLG